MSAIGGETCSHLQTYPVCFPRYANWFFREVNRVDIVTLREGGGEWLRLISKQAEVPHFGIETTRELNC